ncbi:unnamed protein product [Symbiodinium necroappetens]|uniref:Pyrrolo-quinoline quinone repeat domain-containing protein n=2 Tax=Symbiodinium TaxID=2949 RepID=A0A812WN82_9DINO|nr:hypothetical protein AK812_SmicGene24947 [Symbiodinium microadriaticum]CAE7692020.1 unnamed protein product [Symbiodinium necroappetens]CAE7887834.1 unnamed protein product [Symbiodinium microadriaticum]CAE7941235.1 unnamed protein product [Symbiodinium sp. KB8]
MAVQLRAVATAIVACLACGASNDTQLCDGDDETDLPNFQLLQHSLSVSRATRGASQDGRSLAHFAEWIGKNGNSIRSGSTFAVPPHLLTFPSWTWTAPHNALVRSSPIVDPNGDIYVSTSAGELFKFSREGQQLWKRGFKNHYVFANPVYYGHIYTLQDDCTFFAIDAKTGSTVWQRKAGYGSGPDTLSVIAGMGVVVSSCFGKGEGTSLGGATTVVALNATDGSMLWSFRARYPLYNWIGSIQNQSLLFADFFGGTYRLSLSDGSVIWKVPPPSVTGATTGGLASGPNGVVYVTSNHEEIPNFRSGFVSAYLVSDGSLLWRRNTTYAANAGAAISPGSRPFVVVPTGPNPAVALLGGGAKDLEKYNNTDDFRKPGKLVVLDGADGRTLWDYDFPDWYGPAANDTFEHSCLPDSFANPAIAGDGSIFVVGESGHLYRFRDADGDGKVSSVDEIYTHSTGNGFQGAPAISDGILAIAPCNGLQVFL